MIQARVQLMRRDDAEEKMVANAVRRGQQASKDRREGGAIMRCLARPRAGQAEQGICDFPAHWNLEVGI